MSRTQKKSGLSDTETPRRVAGYIRVSTKDQAESKLGLEDQWHRISAMATVKGWPAPIEYADKGISGTKDADKRPGLEQLMADVKSGAIDAVIILDLSRLGRNTRIVLRLVEEMAAEGVSLISCKESLDTTTATGKFVLTLFAALGQLERDQVSERTKGALNSLVRGGKDKGGRAPYGYVRTEGELIDVDESEAETVRDIFTLRKQGASLRKIAEALNEKGIQPPRGIGNVWHHSAIYAILGNESAYRGGGSIGQPHIKWPRILKGKAA